MLDQIIVSKVRVKILEIFFTNPTELYHVRGLVRKTDEEINAVRRELSNLQEAGVVKNEPRGNRIYYWLNPGYLFYPEFLCIFAKNSGLGNQILKNKNRVGKISFCVFSRKFVGKLGERSEEDVDILVVGDVVMAELAGLIKGEEEKRGSEINYTAMSDEEFEFRKRRRDPFLLGILSKSKVMIIGDEEELLK